MLVREVEEGRRGWECSCTVGAVLGLNPNPPMYIFKRLLFLVSENIYVRLGQWRTLVPN